MLRLVRRTPRGAHEARWEPSTGALDPADVAGADAVVNLAGAGVGDHRWTDRYKKLLISSRVDSTGTLAGTIAALPPADRPATLINASAIGWYGDTGDTPVTEEAPAGEGFLPDLCRVWEAATRPAEDAGVRVVRTRTGYVLDGSGGYLKPQLLPFKLGVGGKLASGRQWLPWIALEDWLAAAQLLLNNPAMAGPVNVVGPEPVTNAEFTKALGAALHRPTIVPVPAFGLRLLLGELATDALTSARVLPGELGRAGFTYRYPTLPAALERALAVA